MKPAPAQELAEELRSLFDFGFDAPLGDDGFNRLALRVFEHQFARNRPYAAYCRRRGRTPDAVGDWRDIPAVPTTGFKQLPLVAGDAASAPLVFRTSGTTLGPERRGEHHVLDPALYRAALLPVFKALVLPDAAQLPILSLIPPPGAAPDSSLSYMAGVLVEELGQAGSAWFANGEGDLDLLAAVLRQHEDDGRAVCLLGTSFAFVHLLDRLRQTGVSFCLPAGSRLMDTGGYKGRSRQIEPERMRSDYQQLLGIPASHQVNEYGMTELLSQYYDAVLRDTVLRGTGDGRRKVGPPWLRALVVDPDSLEPVPTGASGILRHVDLANLHSVVAIQTEDLGREVEGGFLLLGRAAGAPPRGCSIAADLLMQAAREQVP